MEEAKLKHPYDYFEPMNNKIILDPKSYNEQKLFWLKYWSRDHDVERLLNSVLIILFCFICFLIFSENKYKMLNLFPLIPGNKKLIHFGVLFSIIMWFFLSPQMRYGGHSIVGGSLIFYASLIIAKNKINRKKFNIAVIFILLISISYFLSKNVTRITKILNNKEFTNFPWPEYTSKLLGKDYIEFTIKDVKLNLITTAENTIKGGPVMCGNVDMLCLPNERIVCISDIYIKNKYIFIKNNNPECLKQFRQNYFQH